MTWPEAEDTDTAKGGVYAVLSTPRTPGNLLDKLLASVQRVSLNLAREKERVLRAEKLPLFMTETRLRDGYKISYVVTWCQAVPDEEGYPIMPPDPEGEWDGTWELYGWNGKLK